MSKQVERAENIASGAKPVKKDRFVKLTCTSRGVERDRVERARMLAGLTGYVTNIDEASLTAAEVVKAYHDLYEVERSFRMAKTDLRARPMFLHRRDSIEARLTIVFTALAIAGELQHRTGVSIQRLFDTLKPLRTDTISINGQALQASISPGPEATEIRTALQAKTKH